VELARSGHAGRVGWRPQGFQLLDASRKSCAIGRGRWSRS
jgi:hypothetical protein